jgi:cytidine deaminase
MTDRELINAAFKAMENAYAPYSGFRVGAAVECEDGIVFTGCNVENAALGDTICAERVALVKAISEGNRNVMRIAVAADSDGYCMPCGSCRQVIGEFAEDAEILSARFDGRYVSYKLSELLPHQFKMK